MGCDDDCVVCTYDDNPPPTPQGVYSITADQEIYVIWHPIDDVDGDFSNYVVYRSDFDPDTGYWAIGTTIDTFFVDYGLENGHTYYYAVSSIDYDGNLSALSYEYVFDTPRPEGFGERIYTMETEPDNSGWYLYGEYRVPWDDPDCDFFLDEDNGIPYLNVGDGYTYIQDMGYTTNFDEISYSPPADSGWSANGWAEVILGHTYVIQTSNSHFAKVRVAEINADNIIFDWGYQVAQGNRELKANPGT